MKTILFILISTLLMLSCSNSQENENISEEYEQFMEVLSVDVTAMNESINIKSIKNFSNIEFIEVIQNQDTIKKYPDKNGKAQIIKDSWYTVETIFKENEISPSSINIIFKYNDTDSDRSLVIRIIRDKNINNLTIIQHKDMIGGDGYRRFMDRLSDTIPAIGGSVTIKSSDIFFYVNFVGIIQNDDTIRTYFDNEKKPQIITNEWYTIETIFKKNDLCPSSINISMTENNTNSERGLLIELPRGNSHNILTIIQKKE